MGRTLFRDLRDLSFRDLCDLRIDFFSFPQALISLHFLTLGLLNVWSKMTIDQIGETNMERIHDESTYYARRMPRKWHEGVCPASEIDARMARDYAEADAAERAHDAARADSQARPLK